MLRETMSPKERWLAVLNRQKPDRIPMDYWATPEATVKLMTYLGIDETQVFLERLRNESPSPDGRWSVPGGWSTAEKTLFKLLHMDPALRVEPEYFGPPLPKNTDVFGCRFQQVDYGIGSYKECIHHPLAKYETLNEIKQNFKWPEPDWWDYSGILDQIMGFEDYPIRGGKSEPFLVYKDLRGDEQAFLDLIVNPEIVHYCLDRLFDLCYENTLRIYEQIPGKVLFSLVAEDFGSQEMLMYSPVHIREFFIPRMKRMINLVHEAGAFVFFHSDGAIRDIIPDMVEAGIDILDPIQWRCKGMDRKELKISFGDRIIFHGGVDNQYTLAFGSVDEVRQEVIDNIHILGEAGGYILGPCHNIQAMSPPENIIVMYRTGLEYGWD